MFEDVTLVILSVDSVKPGTLGVFEIGIISVVVKTEKSDDIKTNIQKKDLNLKRNFQKIKLLFR